MSVCHYLSSLPILTMLFNFKVPVMFLIIAPISAVPNAVTAYEPGIGTWHFNEGYGTSASDASNLQNTGFLSNGPGWTTGKIGLGLRFTCNLANPSLCPMVIFSNSLTLATVYFTISVWAMADKTHQIDPQSLSGADGVFGQRYAIFPVQATSRLGQNNSGSVGLSIGSNGVSVYAHAAFYMPALLVWEGDMTWWTQVTVVCNNSAVALYVNGTFVKNGLFPTDHVLVLIPGSVGAGEYGDFSGRLDELKLFDFVMADTAIRAAYLSDVAGMIQYQCPTSIFIKWYVNNLIITVCISES